MNFVFIFFSSVLLLGSLDLLLNDEVVIIPLQSQIESYQAKPGIENNVDRYEPAANSATTDLNTVTPVDNSAGGTQPIKALEHFVLANKASQQNDSEGATLHLMNALLIDPQYNDARLQLVQNLLDNGQRTLARDALDQAIINNSDSPVFVAMRARMSIQDGDLQYASVILNNALNSFHEDEELMVLAASIDDQLGDYTKAAYLYQQLSAINPLKLSYRVGQAMAIDHAGDSVTATKLYQAIAEKLTESGTRLPFVEQRLAMLTSKTDQTTIQ
ncbi:MAG TPA: tetratricopeptide repeat protein [Crenotrichaceae bacterium]|nr:tetratricopeptide repeat protein [Crenotrichaceae bacterium]